MGIREDIMARLASGAAAVGGAIAAHPVRAGAGVAGVTGMAGGAAAGAAAASAGNPTIEQVGEDQFRITVTPGAGQQGDMLAATLSQVAQARDNGDGTISFDVPKRVVAQLQAMQQQAAAPAA